MDKWGYGSGQALAYSSHQYDRIQQKYSSYWINIMKDAPKTSQLELFLSRHGLSMIPLLMGMLLGVATSTVLFLYPNSPIHGLTGWAKDTFQPALNLQNGWPKGKFQPAMKSQDQASDIQGEVHIRPRLLNEEIRIRQSLYVGVMTAEKFLTTRATAVNNTWGKYVDKMEFFAQKGTYDQYNLKLVNLDVDDSKYPPQQKAFSMMQYMCDHYIDDYDWFIRSDDDVYMKVGKLRELLSTMDRDKMIVLGQPGYGLPEERASLGLDGINFCMGGPGVIFSRPALLNLCPHIDQCKREVYSNQEDVEIGRCITKHLGIQCTRAWDTLKIFYHAYKEDYGSNTPFTSDLENDVHFQTAITLHHAKQPPIMYNIHFHHLQDKYRALQQGENCEYILKCYLKEINQYKKKLLQVEQILNKTSDQAIDPGSESERRVNLWTQMKQDIEVPWNYFTKEKVYGDVNPSGTLKEQLQEAVQEGFQYLKSAQDDNIKIERFDQGYWRHVANAGIQYMLDYSVTMGNPSGTNHLQELKGTVGLMRVHLLQAIEQTRVQISSSDQNESSVKVVVPFYVNKSEMLKNVLKIFSENLLKSKSPYTISVLFIVFCDNVDTNENIPKLRDLIDEYKKQYTFINFKIIFRTATKLYENIEMFSLVMNEQSLLNVNDLILYVKPDVSFDASFISRCIMNSKRGQTIFHAYPESPRLPHTDGLLGSGHVLCGYASDIKIDHSDIILKESLNFYDLFNSDLVIFKANDIGLNLLS